MRQGFRLLAVFLPDHRLLDERRRIAQLGLIAVLGPQESAFDLVAQHRSQVRGDVLPEIVNARLWMFVWLRHSQGHGAAPKSS